MIEAWKKEDNPPSRFKPVPMLILIHADYLCGDCYQYRAFINCIWMDFYFLLLPGEYANSTVDLNHPLRMKDVELKIGGLRIFDSHLAIIFISNMLASSLSHSMIKRTA